MALAEHAGAARARRPSRPTRRRFVAGLGALAALGLAGCGLQPSPGPAAGSGARTPVRLSGLIPATAWAQGLVDEFNQRQEGRIGLTLEQIPYNQLNEKLATYVAAGSPPDLSRAFTGYTRDWQARGLIEPVDELLGRPWLDSLLPTLTQPPHGDLIDGRLYLAYYSVFFLGIIARRDVLQQVGLDPYSFKRFDDLAAAAEKIARDTPLKKPIGLVLGTPLAAAETCRWIFTSHGLESIADLRPERRADYLAALGALLKLAPWIPDAAYGWDYGGADQAFAEGQSAFYPIGTWFFATIYKQAPQAIAEARAIPIPYPGGGSLGVQSVKLTANGWYLLKGGQHKAEAAEFLRFATARETLSRHLTDGGLLPFKGVTVDDQVKLSQFGEAQRWYFRDWLKLADTFKVTPDLPYVAAAETQQIWHEQIIGLLRGRATAEQVYEQLAQRVVPLQERARRG